MITAGKNIRQKNDPLQKLTIERLYQGIVKPKYEVLNKINQLRMMLTIDKASYRKEKSTLPYVCCGNFNPPYRRLENFGSISHFIIDIDHLSEKEINLNKLKDKLKSDQHIELMFASPSGDGLKVFFPLSESCFDAGKYSIFYKIFATEFSNKYGLNQVVDKSTSDVTRACFVSHDPEAYYNPDAQPVEISKYVNFENLAEVKEIEESIKEEEKKNKQKENHTKEKPELSTDILEEIKKKLNPNIRTKKEKIIYVPEEIEEQVENVKAHLLKHDIKTIDVRSIHYGKKFLFEIADKRTAEINLFYGKKGFSVVPTTKTGTDPELAEICHKLMCEIFC